MKGKATKIFILLIIGLSPLVPELGRAYTWSWIDGLLGLTPFYLTANTGYKAYQDNLPIKAPLFIGAAFMEGKSLGLTD